MFLNRKVDYTMLGIIGEYSANKFIFSMVDKKFSPIFKFQLFKISLLGEFFWVKIYPNSYFIRPPTSIFQNIHQY